MHARSGGQYEIMGLMQVRPPSVPQLRELGLRVGCTKGQDRRRHVCRHGLVRPARPRHRDARQRGQRGQRVHGRVPRTVQRRPPFQLPPDPRIRLRETRAGRQARERGRVVPFPPRLRMLALGHRRQHPTHQPDLHRPFRRRRRPSPSPSLLASLTRAARSTRTGPSRPAGSTSAPSAPSRPATPLPTPPPPSTNPSRSPRSRTLAPTPTATTRWRSSTSRAAWTQRCWTCCGTSTGS